MLLKLNDKDLFPYPTTLTAEQTRLDGKNIVQLSLYSDPTLDGEGIFLSKNNIIKLYKWLKEYIGETS